MSSVPVSQYEALRAEMRSLVQQAQQVQEIASEVISSTSSASSSSLTTPASTSSHPLRQDVKLGGLRDPSRPLDYTMESLVLEAQVSQPQQPQAHQRKSLKHSYLGDVEDDRAPSATQMSVSSEPISQGTRPSNVLYHGTWPVERSMWSSEPEDLDPESAGNRASNLDQQSVLSFASSSGGVPLDRVLSGPSDRSSRKSVQQLEAKVDMVYSLLAMLGGQEHADMGDTLLALSTSPESCLAMRQSGCIPLLVQLVQSDKEIETRRKASQALHNLVHAQPDERLRKRETRVLKLLEHVRGYTDSVKNNTVFEVDVSGEENPEQDKHPVSTIANLMKHSFDEGHRQSICQLGGIHIIASLVETEHVVHGSTTEMQPCVVMRRYACMALTNLTFGDSGNKALLCSFREFMRALVVQLQSPSDELRQVTASVLRNLSWRADSTSKEILREVGTVAGLMKAGMATSKENTLKSILSALWNLSAHCTENKLEICAVETGLGFLVDMLSYKAPSKSLTINENAGGILRNISSQIAVRDDYREVLRKYNCLQILLEQLKSPSLTIVSNACGTLWNLSAKNPQDQEALWQMGAPAMLRSLNHSKHKMIATGSSAALKNLLNSRPSHSILPSMDSTARAMDLPTLPTLGVRKQKALLRDLDQNLAETFENIEKDSPKAENYKFVVRSESHEFTTRTELVYETRTTRSEDLCSGFQALNLNEASTSYQKNRLNYNNYRKSYNAEKFYGHNNYPDTETSDQPIDYSRKYSETKKKPTNPNYGIYAETDLDQPTDYSLRYAEDDSDSDIINDKNEDTIKTYCTEGTPLNFSTATSMSDLRELRPDNDTEKIKKKESAPLLSHLDEKDHCSTEDISDNPKSTNPKSGLSSCLTSGLTSPEKPVNYCEEGTPGYFSRVSSFGSLSGLEQTNDTVIDKAEDVSTEVKNEEKDSPGGTESETKSVKFETAVNYAEQTPLMFSRSSSLASLDSVEQHSIHDDRSSIISDFSRLTSGIVSPSELPDSPTQTVPPSPRPRKAPPVVDYSAGPSRVFSRPMPAPRNISNIGQKAASVFEDNVTKFKEESTPVQFSTATSISSLTIDDEPAVDAKIEPSETSAELQDEVEEEEEEEAEKRDVVPEKQGDAEIEAEEDLNQMSENDEDDDILADCINIGMQNNRHRQPKLQNSPLSKIPSYKSPQRGASSIPLPRKGSPSSSIPSRSIPRLQVKTSIGSINSDVLHAYCTEDTPGLSHANSNSDLSVLSLQTDNKSKKDYLSDDSSNLSGDNDNILAECIQSGMPKAVPGGQTPRKVPTSTPVKTYFGEGKKHFTPTQCLGASDETSQFAVENSPCQFSLRSSLSDLTADGSVAGLVRTLGEGEAQGQAQPQEPRLSRQESLSSLSVESFGSIETEQALLDQCISSGMPKSKHNVTPNKLIGVAAKYKPVELERSASLAASPTVSIPKNGNATSAATTTAAAADVGTTTTGRKKRDVDVRRDRTSSGSESPSTPVKVDNRMLDPDAMIESLDRFTAELVSQASTHLNKDKFSGSISESGGDTWNEDISPNDVTFPSISGSVPNVITFSETNHGIIEPIDVVDAVEANEQKSNDFSSMNTSTLTESTLIAMEATKIATTFQQQAELSLSVTSLTSLELDQVPQPSQMNSLTHSVFDGARRSPLVTRKRSLPVGLMVKRALSNSLNQGSLESLSNLDQINPPSAMSDVMDLEGSMISVASLPSETSNPIFNVKQPNSLNLIGDSSSINGDLDNVNPPSLFNEITDMCNSLADVTSENIETEIFEDCNTLKTENDEFSDANSATPLQSDISSAETTPKKRSLGKKTTAKQRRNLAKERYRTYTVAAELVMREEDQKLNGCESGEENARLREDEGDDEDKSEDYKTVNCETESFKTVNVAFSTATYTRSKSTAKERRKSDRSRFETQVLDKTITEALSASDSSTPPSSPAKTKMTIRRSFLQKRLENKDRFKTQVLPEASVPVQENNGDLHRLLEKEANVVLRSLKESKTRTDELLDCETLSLVSNDEDSEHNSASSVNYRTYHKSWGHGHNTTIPIIDDLNVDDHTDVNVDDHSESEEDKQSKPKIVKPVNDVIEVIEEPKGIRGRRKPLYAKTSPKSKTVTSSLVKNVTSTIKTSKIMPPKVLKPPAALKSPKTKPPVAPVKTPKPPQRNSPVHKVNSSTSKSSSTNNSPKGSPVRAHTAPASRTSPLERQGTFTKDDKDKRSRIPSAIPKAASTSRIAKAIPVSISALNKITKSASADRANKPSIPRLYNRSPSADSRKVSGAVKRTIPELTPAPRSNSTTSLTSASLGGTNSKQITSRIASLWKKVEESKKQQQPMKKDTRVWIQNERNESNEDQNVHQFQVKTNVVLPDVVLHDERIGGVNQPELYSGEF